MSATGDDEDPPATATEAFLRSAHLDHDDPPLPPMDDADVGARYARDADARHRPGPHAGRTRRPSRSSPSATRSTARPQRQVRSRRARTTADDDADGGDRHVRQAARLAVPLLVLAGRDGGAD